jgi:hypothetical protein
MRKLLIVVVVGMMVGLMAAPASAAKPMKDSGSDSFSGPDAEASAECGAPIYTDVEVSFSVLVRFTKDGGVLVTDHVVFHATHTNMDTGKSVTSNGSDTFHVVVGAGTDGRDVVRITGLQGHVVAPGSGSTAQDSGQLVIEAFGPDDPDPIFVSEHGLFEGMGGPFPQLCDVLS